MGEPQSLWREIVHSRRFSTIAPIRFTPKAGTHSTFSRISVSARSRSAPRSMNHWCVARKTTGLLQRQQWG